jgi:hypothetical protein
MNAARLALAEYVESRIRDYPQPHAPVPFLAVMATHLRWGSLAGITTSLERVLSDYPLVPGPSVENALRSFARNPNPDGISVAGALAHLSNALVADAQVAGETIADEPPSVDVDQLEVKVDKQLDRDEAIRADRATGLSIRDLAAKYELSVGRTHAICKEVSA